MNQQIKSNIIPWHPVWYHFGPHGAPYGQQFCLVNLMPTPYVHQIVFVWPVRFFPMFSLSDSNFTMATNSVPSSSTPMTIPWKSDTDSLWWADCCCLVYVMPTSIWPPVEQILQCCWVAEVELSQDFLLTHMYTIWYKQLGRFLDICLTSICQFVFWFS